MLEIVVRRAHRSSKVKGVFNSCTQSSQSMETANDAFAEYQKCLMGQSQENLDTAIEIYPERQKEYHTRNVFY